MKRYEAQDISKANEKLGYHAKYGIEEGIDRYSNWIKSILNIISKYL